MITTFKDYTVTFKADGEVIGTDTYNINNTLVSEQERAIVEKENVVVKDEVKPVKNSISSISIEELKGKLLTNLRKIGSEMLWNVVQSVELNVVGNVLTIVTNNSGDNELLDRLTSKEKIEEALSDFLPFELQIQQSSNEKKLDELEQAVERVKSFFGDDIVIIK